MAIIDDIEMEVAEKIKPYYDTDYSGHGFDHAIRTMTLGKYIAQEEGGDILVVSISCLVHDVFRNEESYTKSSHFSNSNLLRIKNILLSLDIHPMKVNQIIKCVSNHENYDIKDEALDIETKILQDADRLDAIGAIGIARVFMFSGAYRISLGNSYDTDKKYSPEKINSSIFAHFNDKLIKLIQRIHTTTGKKLAENRHKFLLIYLDQLKKELNQIKMWSKNEDFIY